MNNLQSDNSFLFHSGSNADLYKLDSGNPVIVKALQREHINNPIILPIGEGIAGYVAKSGLAEIIGDTSKDARYICFLCGRAAKHKKNLCEPIEI